MSEVKREHLAGLYRVADAVEGRSCIRANGMIDGHILLRDIREWIAQASAAPEQEPVAWISPSNLDLVQRGVRLGGCQVSPRRDAEDGLTAGLYTHADPSEVAQLRAENARLLSAGQALEADFSSYRREVEHKAEAANQRADAAERKLGEAFKAVEMAKCLYANNVGIGSELEKALSLLSATAQPAEVKS